MQYLTTCVFCRGSRAGTIALLLVAVVGHALFTMAIEAHSYPAALAGRVLFGLGQVRANGRRTLLLCAAHILTGAAVLVCREALWWHRARFARIGLWYVLTPLSRFVGSCDASNARLQGRELTFAIGLAESFHSVSGCESF
jgi:hypothetical protein